MKVCSIEECSKPSRAQRLCRMHYQRQWKNGTTDPVSKNKSKLLCTLRDCSKTLLCRGYCRTHYTRWYETGSVELGKRGIPGRRKSYSVTAIEERFWKYVDKQKDHWVWIGTRTRLGYGSIWDNDKKKQVMAHRLSWEMANNKTIPAELHIDHLCRVPSCVNPEHLEPVTRKINAQRGIAGQQARERALKQTHCKNGHLRSIDNSYVNKRGVKSCRICTRLNMRKYRAQRKGLN